MRQDEYDEFTSIMQIVSEQYGKPLSGGVIALYWQALKDYDLTAVRDALGRHLRNTDTGQFMPKIADIVRMMHGSSQDSAFSGWSKFDKAIRQVGIYRTVVFDDPIIHRVVHDMGGWVSFGEKTEDAWPFLQNEFVARYRGFKSRNERIEYPATLIGISESHNTKAGKKIEPPVLIGNSEIAMQVMAQGGDGSKLLSFKRMNDILPSVLIAEEKP